MSSTLKERLIQTLRRTKDKHLIEELENCTVLTREEAVSLYNQLSKEWLNRDDYTVLNSAVKELGKAVK